MTGTESEGEKAGMSRREVLKGGTAVSAAAVAAQLGYAGAYAGSTDRIRVGLIGCGGRGTGAAKNCVDSADGVELYAMGDLFRDNSRGRGLENSYNWLKNNISDRMDVPAERRFVGWDAYKKVLQTDVDMVILATPPYFRPIQFKAAIEAGKHVFMEKPVATDPAGIRTVIEASEMAEEKGLSVVAGTQRRHDAGYRAVMKRIHDGTMGDVVGGQCYWNWGTLWHVERQSEWSDLEWQIRNWYYFDWLSGDHITEQHVHNLDVMNWAIGSPPEKCVAMGGRQVRTDDVYGNIYDHFCVDYIYPGNVHVMSMSRQMANTTQRIGEHIVGTKGTSNGANWIKGENSYQFDGDKRNPYVQEHADLIASIRNDEGLNEGARVARSTMTAIMGRMSAYTGLELSWNWIMNESKLDLGPESDGFGSFEPRDVAQPGQRELV